MVRPMIRITPTDIPNPNVGRAIIEKSYPLGWMSSVTVPEGSKLHVKFPPKAGWSPNLLVVFGGTDHVPMV